jgi:hypothetical protein
MLAYPLAINISTTLGKYGEYNGHHKVCCDGNRGIWCLLSLHYQCYLSSDSLYFQIAAQLLKLSSCFCLHGFSLLQHRPFTTRSTYRTSYSLYQNLLALRREDVKTRSKLTLSTRDINLKFIAGRCRAQG